MTSVIPLMGETSGAVVVNPFGAPGAPGGAASALAETNATFDGEPILFKVQLSPRWLGYRCVMGSAVCLNPYLFLGALGYWAFGGSCRQQEFESFQLILTPTTLHHRAKLYGCAVCCQTTATQALPLDKVQDVVLTADCCGDLCGFSERAGSPYHLSVSTAGGGVTLNVACIEDPEGFRSKVLAAKRAALLRGVSSGAGKDTALETVGGDSAAVILVLERIERALTDGIARAAAARRATS